MRYRQEIDGLRALAVLPVILFHSGLEIAHGGFVGVDIFFVISGYLITTIIIENIDKNTFSLYDFYFRRTKRILPALFVVILACLPIAWLIMSPSQLKDFMQSISAVSLFSSNILFLHESGYFETAAEIKPLLHTWSLAVEEQFYFIFPLILLVIGISYKRRSWIIASIAVLSFFLAYYVSTFSREASFYLLPTRAWELLIGSLCALFLYNNNSRDNNLLALLGLILILLPISLYEVGEATLIYMLSAVMGVGLIILFASQSTYIGKILAFRPIVMMGLVSYSAYLWHQPLFAFTRIKTLGPIMWSDWLVLIFLTFIFAYITWRYVEQPCRRMKFSGKKRQFLPFVSISILFLIIGVVGHVQNGFESRFEPEVLQLLASEQDKNPNRQNCHFSSFVTSLNKDKCTFFEGEAQKKALIWGDSHADSVAWETAQALSELGFATTTYSYGGCPPIPSISMAGASNKFQCEQFNKLVIEDIEDSDYDLIVLSARWTLILTGNFFDNEEGGIESKLPVKYIMTNSESSATYTLDNRKIVKLFEQSMQHYLSNDTKVFVIEPIPEAGWNVPQEIAKRYLVNKKIEPVSTDYAVYQERHKDVFDMLSEVKDPDFFVVKPAEVFCNSFIPHRCINSTKDESFYSDDDHLSKAGSALLALKIKNKVLDVFNYN